MKLNQYWYALKKLLWCTILIIHFQKSNKVNWFCIKQLDLVYEGKTVFKTKI